MQLLIDGTLPASRIALGCMRISSLGVGELSRLVHTAMENGINFFDHADIYAKGESEALFGKLLKAEPGLRGQVLLQSKCGIRQGMYDFSKEHIISAAQGSLARLGVDYLDTLLLHRPDALMEPEEVAEAFTRLSMAGKVRYFGVSNHNPSQMALLQKYLPQRLCINQLQFSVTNAGMVDRGIHVNMETPFSFDKDGGILDYCRLNNITIQPWSPLQFGFFEGVFLGSAKHAKLNEAINALAERYAVAPGAIAIAWILRHPAQMQPIIGTTNAKRVEQMCAALNVKLQRKEWYDLYLAAGRSLP